MRRVASSGIDRAFATIPPVRISSKADYAVRAALELAAAAPLSADTISQRQGIPAR